MKKQKLNFARPWSRNGLFWGMFCLGWAGIAEQEAVASEGVFSFSLP